MWENYSREQYIKFCVDGGKAYVFSDGAPNTYSFTYNPFSADDDGDNVVTIPQNIPISTMNFTYFRWLHRWLQMQVPMGAIGSLDGRPSYGISFDVEDFDKMVEDDASLREDYRHARPSMLIDNYGSVESYKGYALMHDVGAPRFAVKFADGTDVTLKRVDPLVETEDVTIGQKVTVNPDYLLAEFALGVIIIKNVFRIEVPPAGPANPGGRTSFGATPGLNGEFTWLNIQNEETNLLRENGLYFGRFESFASPLENNYDAIAFIYRRCPQSSPTDCNIGGSDTAAAGADVALASTPVTADIDTTNFMITLTLAQKMAEEAGDPIVVTSDDTDSNTEIAGIIADSSQAPTYTFALVTTPGAASIYTHTDGPHVHGT